MSSPASFSPTTGSANEMPTYAKLLRRLSRFAWPGKFNAWFRHETAAVRSNESMLLEESIALFDGKVNPIKYFSAKELEKATNNFHRKHIVGQDSDFTLYRCFVEDRMVILKKYDKLLLSESPIRDIVIASRMSVHKNVLKLLGCCSETQLPILVFESVGCEVSRKSQLYGTRGDWFRNLQWKDRLKVAVDISNLVAYLHTAFPRPIVHRNLKFENLLLDEDGVVKLFDFSLSIPIPEGQSTVEDSVVGTWGSGASEYVSTGKFNEKIDVYLFGVFLLFLLSGATEYRSLEVPGLTLIDVAIRCSENEKLDEFIDPKLSEEGPWLGQDNQFKAFCKLALWCTKYRPDERPDITDVARLLKEMHRSMTSNF